MGGRIKIFKSKVQTLGGEGKIQTSAVNLNLGRKDVNLRRKDANLGRKDVNLGRKDTNLSLIHI